MKFLTNIPYNTRSWLYRVAFAVMALAVAYGFITVEDAPLWLGLVIAVLGVGGNAMATANTSTTKEPDQ